MFLAFSVQVGLLGSLSVVVFVFFFQIDMVSSLEGAKGKRSLESVSKPAPSSKRSRGLTDDNTWNQKFFELMLYRAKSGDIHIEPSDEEHKDLYEWIDQQRQEYKRFTKNKQNSLLNEDRVQVLKSVGFSFLVRNNKSWQHQYEQLKKFKKRYGHVLVQRNVEFKGLGDWVVAQRTQHGLMKEGQDSQMDSHRKALLDEIGFVWQVRNRPGWQARYDELVEFKSKHGHTVSSRTNAIE